MWWYNGNWSFYLMALFVNPARRRGSGEQVRRAMGWQGWAGNSWPANTWREGKSTGTSLDKFLPGRVETEEREETKGAWRKGKWRGFGGRWKKQKDSGGDMWLICRLCVSQFFFIPMERKGKYLTSRDICCIELSKYILKTIIVHENKHIY